jgi:hypothetical protein
MRRDLEKKFFYNFGVWKNSPPGEKLFVIRGGRYLLSMAPCLPDGKNPKHTHSCSALLRAGVLFVFNRRRDRGCVLSRCKVKHGHPSHAKRDNTYTRYPKVNWVDRCSLGAALIRFVWQTIVGVHRFNCLPLEIPHPSPYRSY